MEAEYRKEKKNSLLKKLESYISINKRRNNSKTTQQQVAPRAGCFTVYVGPEKQRFVIKTEYANHPLFKMLLEDAELEYGFTSDGPLLIPCQVHLFCKILAEMEHSVHNYDDHDPPPNCGYASCSPFRSPARRLSKTGMAKSCSSSYGLLVSPQLLKINHF